MVKKLTKEEKEAYRLIQKRRGIIGAKKAGKKVMAKRGAQGAKVKWDNYRKKLSTGK